MVGHLIEPHRSFSWTVRAIAFVDHDRQKAMPYKPLYRYPSAFTRPGPAIDALVQEARDGLRHNPRVQSPLEIATYMMNVLFERFEYVPGVTSVRTTAEQALAGGRGVCQDYAHILIACCRKLGVMARYVAGLLNRGGGDPRLGRGLPGGQVVEPRPDAQQGGERRLCEDSRNGRDYGDCMLDIGVFRGNVTQRQTVVARMEEQ